MPLRFRLFGALLMALAVLGSGVARSKDPLRSSRKPIRDSSAVLAVVNGVSITENQLALDRLIRNLPAEPTPAERDKTLDQLIDNELMRQFLADRRAVPDSKQVVAAVSTIKERLRHRSAQSEQELRRLGVSEAALRRVVSLPLAWDSHLRRVLTQSSIREEFERRQTEYDGTELRASQIFVKLPPAANEADVQKAGEKLAGIRADIVAHQISFSEAARRFSEAPSRDQGGDMGFFPFRGPMPSEICRAIFALPPGEVSQPVRTRFGMHLYTVTDRRPGNLSLEDVRPLVIGQLSKELWEQLLHESRAKATIQKTTKQAFGTGH